MTTRDRFDLELAGDRYVVVVIASGEEALDGLTPAERAIAADVVAGCSNAEIARRRKRAVRTIANQLASIYRKLGLASRAELATYLLHR